MTEEIDIGTSYVPYLKTFQILDHHTYVTAYDLSERCVLRLSQATRKHKKTTHKFLCSAVIMLDWRYCTGRVFTRKILKVQW